MTNISKAIEAFARGQFVIVMDDYERENEGDLICCAQTMTEQQMTFMLNHTTGIVCVAMEAERLKQLQLHQMVKSNTDRHKTAFTVSVDLKSGITTGVSSHDRVTTIRALANISLTQEHFSRPGHIFPLRYTSGGLLVRRGHTEAAIDLCKMSKVYPAGVLCELQNEDGTMSRLKDCQALSIKYRIPIVSIQEMVDYIKLRPHTFNTAAIVEEKVSRISETVINLCRDNTTIEKATMRIYRSMSTGVDHVAIFKGKLTEECYVRVHSECVTGDLFGSLHCDCGEQLTKTYSLLRESGNGVIIYLRDHEGRGIGLSEKIKAYQLQSIGYDTVEANKALGYENDYRTYDVAAAILEDLGVYRGVLLTNNPLKMGALAPFICKAKSLCIETNLHNERYIKTKQEKCGHIVSKL